MPEPFGTLPDGRVVFAHTLKSAGLTVEVLSLGGIVRTFLAPDRHGNVADVTLGYDDLASYAINRPHFGAIIGRCANRIANGEVVIDGVRYTLPRNDGRNTLHGGGPGFHNAVWDIVEADAGTLVLAHESPDGDQGLPGAVRVEARYSLVADALQLDLEARTTRTTILNLTSHAYWNLSGGAAADILDHKLELAADAYTPVNVALIPTGEILPVAGTPLDFRASVALRKAVSDTCDAQVAAAGGVDHNFVLRGPAGMLRSAARLHDPASGRTLEVLTTQPGLQVYTGNGLAGGLPGKGGRSFARWGGIALETQHFPDAPHRPDFPSIVLRPGEDYRTSTTFRATAEGE